MDRITRSLLEDFCAEHEISIRDLSKAFEHFCNYSIVSKEYRGAFDLEDLDTGEGGDGGIDGIAIIVNGRLVVAPEEVDDLVTSSGYMDVDLIFTQAETSDGFDSGKIGKFTRGVKDFTSEKPQLSYNDSMKSFLELWDHCIKRSSDMIRRLPNCKLYYITTGRWTDDANLVAARNMGVAELEATNLFESVKLIPCGAVDIQRLYRDTKNKLQVTINFTNKITLPEITDVNEAYFGLLPFSEYKKLIMDDDGKILNVFQDNIRDFQGENDVNDAIKKTLEDKKYDMFCVLNNGVTVVADSITPAGNRFTLRDFQIVNGCQTSHVLHQCSGLDGIDNVNVPVRLIVTSKDEVRNLITLATNSQTEVKAEQLEAQNVFQKNLEQYYGAVSGEPKLFYERRSQQYHARPEVKKTYIISIPVQIKTFSSMFLDLPHNVSGYYGTIAKSVGQNIFNRNHMFSPYYTSGLAWFRLEALFRSKAIDPMHKKARFYLLMIARYLQGGAGLPPWNGKKMDSYCAAIDKVLVDEVASLRLFQRAIEVFQEAGLDASRRQYKSESDRDAVLAAIRATLSRNAAE